MAFGLAASRRPGMTSVEPSVGTQSLPAGEKRAERPAEIIDLKRLLQGRTAAIGFGESAPAVAGDEYEGHPATSEDVSDREDVLAVEIDVENGEIERAAFCHLGG